MRSHTVLRWDLDKTYLVSNFESLRALLWIPFERAEDKVNVPGVVALIKALRRTSRSRGQATSLYFLSASPPQIGRAIKEKLALDEIGYDGIRFKDQMRHIMRGRFDHLREQIGYKLSELLDSGHQLPSGAVELLFGDDWESDPFLYSLYADVVAGRVGHARALALLARAGVDESYLKRVRELLAHPLPQYTIGAIFVLRQKRRSSEELAAFGPRLVWFDNYFECALRLHAAGLLDVDGVLDVARESALEPADVAFSLRAVCTREAGLGVESFGAGRRALVRAGLMDPVASGNALRRGWAALRRMVRLPPRPLAPSVAVPDYEALLPAWAHRARKEVRDEE